MINQEVPGFPKNMCGEKSDTSSYVESPAVLFDGGMGHRSNAELDSDDEEVQEDQDGE